MKNSVNRNPYEFSLQTVQEVFAPHLQGKVGGLVGIVSNLPLGDAARNALESSARALGFGDGSCCYVTVRTSSQEEASILGANDLRMVMEGADPHVIVATDAQAASLLSHAYQCEVATNATNRVLGRTCVAFKDMSRLLDTPENKQKVWALLKQLA